ncbi:tubulin epsilon and delta complex protein 1 [Salarias fasciatus]|uniref:tubulin epsilon and delta complex protein 1 n=1 Tax=Salarias fasciatus TaxID=181472 RepID=UPI0011769EE0|nr:tubulin epsilon and delta complex protein 1 [Salarias fasciatus]
MQRNKSSSVEVKQVIGALCRLLAAAGLDAVPAPETFRRAKFAGRGEEDPFWKLLSSILLTAGVVSPEVSTRLGGDCRKLVAVGLWQTGYYADWMHGGDGGEEEEKEEEGRSFSSRDLLLALGWLLAAGTLEKLVTQRVQKVDTTLLVSLPRDPQLSSELQFDSACLRRLHWLTGSLRHQGRTLLSMLRERTGALHAVLSVSVPSTGSYSSGESSEVLSQDCVRVRQLCDLLEAYLNWKQVEAVFWTWMDSVMDCHLTESVVKKPTPAFDGVPRVCHHQNRGLEKLEDMLLRLHISQEEQRSDRGAVGERRVGDCSLPPPVSPLPDLSAPTRVCRARLQTERPVGRSSRPAEGPPGSPRPPDHLPASQAAEMLRCLEAQLLERRDRQRLANREQLQEMIGRLDGLVLIPP